jgi:hypothetical protein
MSETTTKVEATPGTSKYAEQAAKVLYPLLADMPGRALGDRWEKPTARVAEIIDAAHLPLFAALERISKVSIKYEEDSRWTWRDLCLESERIAREALGRTA